MNRYAVLNMTLTAVVFLAGPATGCGSGSQPAASSAPVAAPVGSSAAHDAAPAASPASPASAPGPALPQEGTWVYAPSWKANAGYTAGIEYTLSIASQGATLIANGQQTNINVSGEFKPTGPGAWDYVVVRDWGSVPPYTVGVRLFSLNQDNAGLVATNGSDGILEIPEGQTAVFKKK